MMGHYNPIARELADSPEEYTPVLDMDTNSGEASWIPWIDGFERAMWLRPDVGGGLCRATMRISEDLGHRREEEVARPAGLEPATFWFVARRSIQLS